MAVCGNEVGSMTQERRIDRTPELWAGLAGRTIIVAGPDEDSRQEFAQNLAHLAGLQKTELHIGDRPETATGEAFVILFAGMPQADLTGEQQAGAESAAADGSGASHPEQGNPAVLSEVLDSLERLSNAGFAAAVVVTNYRVFGKSFGRERALCEEELGYVCHTSAAEQPKFGMRLAEQLACRMAREDGVNIKVARIPCAAQSGDSRKRLIEAVLYVLLHGEAGEIYSLPDMQGSPVLENQDDRFLSAAEGGNDRSSSVAASGKVQSMFAVAGGNVPSLSAAEEQNWQAGSMSASHNSPLSPIRLRPDTRKFEKLMERI